jgi:hypothetical protein
VGAGLREIRNAQATIAFQRNVFGRAIGFRMQDPFDNTADHTTGVLGRRASAPACRPTSCTRTIPSAARLANRKIVKPVMGSLSVKRAGVLQVQGVGAGNYAVDYTTGVVTFVADASSRRQRNHVGRHHAVQLAGSLAGADVGEPAVPVRLWRCRRGAVNGKAHTISAIAGATYTVAINTAGKTITASGGRRRQVPAGGRDAHVGRLSFDVPVRFDNDWLELQLDEGGLLQYNNVILRELRL